MLNTNKYALFSTNLVEVLTVTLKNRCEKSPWKIAHGVQGVDLSKHELQMIVGETWNTARLSMRIEAFLLAIALIRCTNHCQSFTEVRHLQNGD